MNFLLSSASDFLLTTEMPQPPKFVLRAALAALLLAGCASHPRDFIPNGAGANLGPTDPAHVQVLDDIPKGMVIGTLLVDRSKARTTDEIIEAARIRAASLGADWIVWEDSLGIVPTPSATPNVGGPPDPNTGSLPHDASLPVETPPEQTAEKSPKARFTIGIFVPGQ
jgi:hypothetical protein